MRNLNTPRTPTWCLCYNKYSNKYYYKTYCNLTANGVRRKIGRQQNSETHGIHQSDNPPQSSATHPGYPQTRSVQASNQRRKQHGLSRSNIGALTRLLIRPTTGTNLNSLHSVRRLSMPSDYPHERLEST